MRTRQRNGHEREVNELPPPSSVASVPPVRRVVRRDPANSRVLVPVLELAEGTSVGEAYLGSLIKAQLGLAISFCMILLVLLGALASALIFIPPLRHRTVGGLPVAWLVLGVATYPSFAMLAWIYNRRADKNESRFVDLSLNKPSR
jgi:hypothetical protein